MNVHRVTLSKNVLQVLVNAAIQGYQASYKQERLGILLGRINRNVAVVQHAEVLSWWKSDPDIRRRRSSSLTASRNLDVNSESLPT